jgi:uncharacterized membrane protein (UPF0127 family)
MLGTLAAVLLSVACGAGSTEVAAEITGPKNDLPKMKRAVVNIKGHAFDAWLAFTPQEQQTGLMNTTAAEMAPTPDGHDRGMLFVFDDDRVRGFWMLNTIIPLDIAYIRSDGTIVRIDTMPPLELRIFSSVEPAQFALEVNAGRFKALGIIEGDRVEIPDGVLKTVRP